MPSSEFRIENSEFAIHHSRAIITVATALMAVGLVMVASTSASLERPLFAPGWWGTPLGRQAIFVSAGFILMVVTSWLAVPFLGSPAMRRWLPQLLFVLAVGCLLAAFVPGIADVHRGSHRWLRFTAGGVDVAFQPSEPAKVALVALLAWLLTRPGVAPSGFKGFQRCFLPASLAIGICVLLVGKEDFGTSVLIAAVGFSILFVAGSRLRHLALLGGLGACGFVALLYAAPYRLARIAGYRSFWEDPRGDGYQPLQSLATIASGGWFGTGLGSGVQKYGYLPECRTDFVFAMICEEMGAFGGIVVIGLFCAFVWLGLRAMLGAQSPFERLAAFGLTATMGLQAAMNIAVVTVVTPTTGISLPLISAGGSGVLTYCLAAGVLAAIAGRGDPRTETADACTGHTYVR